MFVELSAGAQTDLEAIERYIAAEGHTPNPKAAKQTVAKVLKAIEVLRLYPRFGKPGRVRGTFELDVSTAPYYVIYRFIGEDLIPSGVDNDLFHGSGFAPRVGAGRSAMRGIGQVSRRPPRGKGAPPKAALWAALAASRAACGAPHHRATRS